jgi:KUP system potassium uptake protein
LFILFTIQQFGTKLVGKFFRTYDANLVWNVSRLRNPQITQNTVVLKAINPYYAYHLLSIHPEGFFVLGFVFLCTTGAGFVL